MAMGDMVVDFCGDHGIWLDHGELDILLRRAGSGARRGRIAKMRRARKAGYDVGYAQAFGGKLVTEDKLRMWLADRRSERLDRALSNDGATVHGVKGPKACPICRETMETRPSRDHFKVTPDVTLDRCEEHGIWLDKGELDVLAARAGSDARRNTRSKVRGSYRRGLEEGRASGRRRSSG
jgi:Zn-finger nucleic acid-binding protein